jgi:hypothetical protein
VLLFVGCGIFLVSKGDFRLKKTFILYREIVVRDDLMECIYFSGGNCLAQPTEMKAHAPSLRMPLFKPSKDEKKELCLTRGKFLACGRFKGYQQHLKALGLTK